MSVIVLSAVLLAGCGSSKKAGGLDPKLKAGEASEYLATVFTPMIEHLFWGASLEDCAEHYGVADAEKFQGDGFLTIPLYTYVYLDDHRTSVWVKLEEENNQGLYDVTMKFEPEEYEAIRDKLRKELGAFELEGATEQSVLFESGKISEYYTEEELRALLRKLYTEEEITDEMLGALMDSSEFSCSVRASGQLNISARNYLILKMLREAK